MRRGVSFPLTKKRSLPNHKQGEWGLHLEHARQSCVKSMIAGRFLACRAGRKRLSQREKTGTEFAPAWPLRLHFRSLERHWSQRRTQKYGFSDDLEVEECFDWKGTRETLNCEPWIKWLFRHITAWMAFMGLSNVIVHCNRPVVLSLESPFSGHFIWTMRPIWEKPAIRCLYR